MTEREFDVIVLGAGPAGEVCAGYLAEAGLAVAIAERHLVGGECSYYACMPSKALLRPADVLAEARRIPGVAGAVRGGLDPRAILGRRDEVIHQLDDSAQLPWLEKRGIELLRGTARLAGERRVEVGEEALRARRAVVVATGSGAAMPPVDGLADVSAWNNRQGTTSPAVPESLIVLGGGPVGCELAQAWASLGSEVVLIEAEERLLGREEPFAGEELAAALRERHGVDVRLGASLERVRRDANGRVVANLADGSEASAAEILVAVGRKPATADIGLASAGVETDEHGFVAVDARMRVGGHEWLYAIGDVNGRALFTHTGKYQGWVAAENLLGREAEAVSEALGPPRVTFTDPQVAAVGKTLAEARHEGINTEVVEAPTDSTAGASFQGKGSGGTSHLVIDKDTETIVGATFTGFETADLLHAATVAIVAAVPLHRLRHAVAAYPSRSEIWLKLLDKQYPPR